MKSVKIPKWLLAMCKAGDVVALGGHVDISPAGTRRDRSWYLNGRKVGPPQRKEAGRWQDWTLDSGSA